MSSCFVVRFFSSHFLVPPVMFEESLPFYNLTGIPGLKELPRAQDSHSGPIFLPGSTSLLYGDQLITKIYVSAVFVVVQRGDLSMLHVQPF